MIFYVQEGSKLTQVDGFIIWVMFLVLSLLQQKRSCKNLKTRFKQNTTIFYDESTKLWSGGIKDPIKIRYNVCVRS